jgi:hypothetical protein
MSTNDQLSLNNRSGTLRSPWVAVPPGATYVVLEFDGNTLLDPAVTLDSTIEFSPDGGASSRVIGGANMTTGAKMRDGVTPVPSYPTGAPIPQDGADPMLRGALTIGNGPITTVLHIRTTP